MIDNEEERGSPGATDASSEVKILQEAVSIVAKLQVTPQREDNTRSGTDRRDGRIDQGEESNRIVLQ